MDMRRAALALAFAAAWAPPAAASALDELRAAAKTPELAFDGAQQQHKPLPIRANQGPSTGPRMTPFDEGIDRSACRRGDNGFLCVGKILGTPVLAPGFASVYGAADGWRRGGNVFTKVVFAAGQGLLGLVYGAFVAPFSLLIQLAQLILS